MNCKKLCIYKEKYKINWRMIFKKDAQSHLENSNINVQSPRGIVQGPKGIVHCGDYSSVTCLKCNRCWGNNSK